MCGTISWSNGVMLTHRCSSMWGPRSPITFFTAPPYRRTSSFLKSSMVDDVAHAHFQKWPICTPFTSCTATSSRPTFSCWKNRPCKRNSATLGAANRSSARSRTIAAHRSSLRAFIGAHLIPDSCAGRLSCSWEPHAMDTPLTSGLWVAVRGGKGNHKESSPKSSLERPSSSLSIRTQTSS